MRQAPAAEARFRVAFAGFLRRRGESWRLRRRDFLMPLDLYLARRQVSVQGEVTSALVAEFIEEQRGQVRLPRAWEDGREFLLYVPFGSFPKRLLLDFSTSDPSGARIPILTRREGSRVTAQHLLSILGAEDRLSGLTPREVRAAAVVLEVLATSNPTALHRAIDRWSATTYDQTNDQRHKLDRWVHYQATEFNERLPNHETAYVSRQLATLSATHPLVKTTDVQARDGIGKADIPFASLAELVVYSIHEAFEVLLPPTNRVPRNDEIRRRLVQLVPLGIETIAALLASLEGVAQGELVAIQRELMLSAATWMPYLTVPVSLDHPFHYRSSELLPLARPGGFFARQSIRFFTAHTYRVDPTDALANHFEIATGDPELVIQPGRTRVVVRGERKRPEELFGDEFRESLSVVHFYNARRRHEEPLRGWRGPYAIQVWYRLPRAMVTAYLAGAIALAADLIWNIYDWFWRYPDTVTRFGLLTIGAAFVAFIVFLMTIQHRKPVVEGKLQTAHFAFCLVLVALVVVPAIGWYARLRNHH